MPRLAAGPTAAKHGLVDDEATAPLRRDPARDGFDPKGRAVGSRQEEDPR
jgi:hypothetical protein